jgi:biopolymer transport protein ExbD
MRFSRPRDRARESEISVTPLIDLFLNILVFFLVATTFASDSVFFVDLPEARPSEKIGERKSIVVDIDSIGRIALDKRILTVDQLRAQLSEIPKARRGQLPVVLRADRNTKHGTVVSVIDVARELGLTNLGIITQAPKAE